jgi:plastocyanin
LRTRQHFLAVTALIAFASVLRAETIDVVVTNTEFIPPDVTINVGDTVRWTNEIGSHNVVAQNNSFESSGIAMPGAWVHEVPFTEESLHIYRCEPHSSDDFQFGMVGSVTVEKAGFQIGFGITGSWFDPTQNGQGFSLEVVPASDVLVAYWFTFPPQGVAQGVAKGELPNQMWLQGSGPIDGDTAVVTFQLPVGGAFDAPGGVDREDWGTATFTFTDCVTGVATYQSLDGKAQGTVPLARITADVNCEAEQSGN